MGAKCLEKLNGMFAFAIWDRINEGLYLCDRLGIKPLYFFEGNENFLFASEIRALLDSELIPRKLAHANLEEFLKYQTVHALRTLIKDVFMIPPRSYLKMKMDLALLKNHREKLQK